MILQATTEAIDKKTEDKQTENDKKITTNRRNYSAAPARTLNLPNIPNKRNWLAKAEESIQVKAEILQKESRRVRKKKLWLERKENGGKVPKKPVKYVGDWMYLPDLVLQLIFQYLPFEVYLKINYYLSKVVHI
jgi:hypothetical protein